MIIEVCSQAKATELAAAASVKTSIISITSLGEPDVSFGNNPAIVSVLHLRFNDLTEEYDEEGIPYGRPLPEQKDLEGLKAFVDDLACEHLIIHCWEGTSRSAAVAAAVSEYLGLRDQLRTSQPFAPNPLVYALARRELK